MQVRPSGRAVQHSRKVDAARAGMMSLNHRDDGNATPNPLHAAQPIRKDLGWQALGPAIACTIVTIHVVALRCYTRYRLVRCVGLDDYTILLSTMLAIAMCALVGAAKGDGIGVYHGLIDTTHLAKLLVANNILWVLTVNITKASILVQYLRIFSGRPTRMLCCLLMFTLLPATCWAVFGGTFLCRPIDKLWLPALAGRCRNSEQYWLSVAGLNIGLDLVILLLPLPAIARLRLPRKAKAALVLVFLLGFLVCAVSVARLATVLAAARAGDPVASGLWAVTWSVVEAHVGIVCASLLALKPLAAHWWPRLWADEALPKHCMRLPRVETARAGSAEGSVRAMLQVRPLPLLPAGSPPILTTSSSSTGDGDGGGSSRRQSPVEVSLGFPPIMSSTETRAERTWPEPRPPAPTAAPWNGKFGVAGDAAIA